MFLIQQILKDKKKCNSAIGTVISNKVHSSK